MELKQLGKAHTFGSLLDLLLSLTGVQKLEGAKGF